MKKISSWVKKNYLFLCTLFLLSFIPLYPKLPLIDIKNTWVYVRAEDFAVLAVLLIWGILLLRRKITLKTPLTIPILGFWIIGAVSTLYGIILIFPNLANVFPNVAFLSYLRHIEYMALFFVAYASIKNKKFINPIVIVLCFTLTAVVLYGLGQKYLSFPAYLTMNEEFAKGLPIKLSSLSRLPSTFAGHYDLAAYLVLVVPVIFSLIFSIKNWLYKILLTILTFSSFYVMIMTVSRVSFIVLLVSLFIVLIAQRRKFVFFAIPIVFMLGLIFIFFQSSLLARFGNTVKKVDVLVNAKTGEAVGNVEYVPAKYLKSKKIKLQRIDDSEELTSAIGGEFKENRNASTSAILPIDLLPPDELVPLVKASNISTGETLPQGTGYINLSLSPVVKRVGDFYYELSPDVVVKKGDLYEEINFHGDFIIKNASAYDLSFTTRFQGEWPRAMEAFERNVLLGSGYGSVSLAVDNNFLRMLGEIGLLGVASFLSIFIVLGIFIKKNFLNIDSKTTKAFIVGLSAGIIGLFLNATLIDVFEASKIAFSLWILIGIAVGIIHLYSSRELNVYKELRNAATSTLAVIVYFFIAALALYMPMVSNFFVGDDFTWFKWAANPAGLLNYFLNSDGFFYRPGTKIYFEFMYSIFWMNQTVYHLVSIGLHFFVSILFYFLARKIFKNKLLAFVCGILFLISSGISENIFWVAATGHLVVAVCALASILLFIKWAEGKNLLYYVLSLLISFFCLLFQEGGVIIPLLIVSYAILFKKTEHKKLFKDIYYYLLFLPGGLYMILRIISNSQWFSGDYSYNLVKLPFNFVGNLIGYSLLTYLGPVSLPLYEGLRNAGKSNLILSLFLVLVVIFLGAFIYIKFKNAIEVNDRRIIIFSFLFFFISLLPYLGLGNITQRYDYLASLGLIVLLVLLIKKAYEYLQSNGREIAFGSVSVFTLSFIMLHIIQLQGLNGDWRGAGDKVKNFFISIDENYSDYWGSNDIDLRFVDVPIKNGYAWVFPVGLSDAVWISFKNDKITVYQDADVEYSLKEAGDSIYNKVFIFQDNGMVKEVFRKNPSVN